MIVNLKNAGRGCCYSSPGSPDNESPPELQDGIVLVVSPVMYGQVIIVEDVDMESGEKALYGRCLEAAFVCIFSVNSVLPWLHGMWYFLGYSAKDDHTQT